MRKWYEILMLTSRGVPLITAWRKSMSSYTRMDKMMVFVYLMYVLYAVTVYALAALYYKFSDLEADKYIAIHKASVHAQAREHNEKIIIGILNGEGVVENGIDRPCTCGEYKNGFARYAQVRG